MLVFLALFVSLVVAGLLLEAALRRLFPNGYPLIRTTAWWLEGILAALIVASLIYQYFTGHLPG